MVITETILVNNLPKEFLGSYHHEHMDNTRRCQFITLYDGKTRYDSHIESVVSFLSYLLRCFQVCLRSSYRSGWIILSRVLKF